MFTHRVISFLTSQALTVLRLAFILLLTAAVPAWAATHTVTNSNDSGAGSLRAQIATAATGDTIVFDAALDGATISLTTFVNDLTTGSKQFGPSAFFITGSQALTIDATANGLTKGIVIARSSAAGTANFRLFDVGVGSSLTLRGVTLSNGYVRGGSSLYAGGALGAGGAIFNQGTLTLDRCTLTGNTAVGGDVFSSGNSGGGGTGANSSYDGGGPNGGAAGTFTFDGSNAGAGGNGGFGGGGGGGGIAAGGDGGNGGNGGNGGHGGFGGGGGQYGYGTGGGAYGNGGNGGFGGGAGPGRPSNTPAGIPGFGGGSAITYGGAGAGMGGAIFNDAGTVMLTNVTFSANAANGGSNPRASFPGAGAGSGYGGAIFNYAGALTLDFVTLSGNNVAKGASGTGGTANGGAIYSLGDSAAACSAGGNTCTTAGNATVTMNRSIAANSTAGVSDVVVNAINAGSSTGSGAYNAIGAATGFTATNAVSGTLSLAALPAALTGGMADVMIPQAGSVAINAAGAGPCSSATDQRGITRPQGSACDVGAVEVVPVNQATLTAIATPASIVFNATSALSTTGGSGTGAVSYAVTAGNAFCSMAGSTLTGTGVGTCTVTATKAGDGSYNATTATATVTVGKAATATTLVPPAAIVLGQTTTVTASVAVVAPGGGTPTGTITISDGGAGAGDTCTITLPATSCALTPSAAGNQALTATYSGDSNFTSSSANGTLAVNTRPTTITLTNSPNPSRVGEPVNLVATVSFAVLAQAGISTQADAVPTGSVTFSDGATAIGTVPLNASGTATLVTSTLTQGSHTLTALYSGDPSAAQATITAAQQVDAAQPVAVPSLSVWMLALLSFALAGAGLVARNEEKS